MTTPVDQDKMRNPPERVWDIVAVVIVGGRSGRDRTGILAVERVLSGTSWVLVKTITKSREASPRVQCF